MEKTCKLLIILFTLFFTSMVFSKGLSSAAFYYGSEPPVDVLSAYDAVIVSPDSAINVKQYTAGKGTLYAYVSAGELDKDVSYAREFSKDWVMGENKTWQSSVIDQTKSGWQTFFIDKIITPLWNRGFHGFFLDTLDSYQLAVTSKEGREKQVAALVSLIKAIKQKYPEAKIILNRGFELLPSVHNIVEALAVESLFSSWNQKQKRYQPVDVAEREALLTELNKVKSYQVPIIVIDYVSPENRQQAKEVSKKIQALGMIPWITDGYLQTVGVGDFQALPRKVLMVYTETPGSTQFDTPGFMMLGMPLQYLGYLPEFRTIGALPRHLSKHDYAGIVVWVSGLTPPHQTRLHHWLVSQLNKIPILIMGEFGFELTPNLLQPFHIHTNTATANARHARVMFKDDNTIGFEQKVYPNPYEFQPLRAENSRVLLKIATDDGQIEDAAAITPWGGYVLNPYVSSTLPNDINMWIVNPFSLLKTALRLPDMPVPDITSENGLRLMMVHIDGDGFLTRADWPKGRIAAIELKEHILQKYQIPTSVSVVTADFARDGLYPTISDESIAIAKDIFSLPWVEPASHTFSHPFDWILVQTQKKSGQYNLPVPGYQYNVNTEITGSIDFINKKMLPADKKAKMLFWSGYANPDTATVKLTYRDELTNINGGNTIITKSLPYLSLISPPGLFFDKYYQVYAPIANEVYYTNGWTGPFYGFAKVIDTLELTGKPKRYKPIDIYYHFYSASKKASLNALQKIYDWSLSQNVMNIFTSEYIEKVADSNNAMIAKKDDGGWLIKTNGHLRELRVDPAMGYPDLNKSKNIIGFNEDQGSLYIHLGPESRSILYFTKEIPSVPYIKTANATITHLYETNKGFAFRMHSFMPIRVELANMKDCSLQYNNQTLTGNSSKDNDMTFTLSEKDSNEFTIECH